MNRTLALLAGGALAYAGARALRRREMELYGKRVLITGGSRGLGLLLARELAAEGCRLAICARDAQELDVARRELEARGADVLAEVCDVADRAQVEALVERVGARFGGVDVLINNAGIIQVGPLEAMRTEDFERAMDVMFWGVVHTTLAVLPQMRARRAGRVVNVTSIGGKVAAPHLVPYDAAKFAAVGFSEGLRAELAQYGVLVTTVVPGLMRTGSPVNALFKGDAEDEFAWFSLSSATPLTTMSGERAARRIVRALRRGEAEVTLTWQAKLLRMSQGLFPGATADLLGVVNRVLPRGTDPHEVPGMKLATPVAPSRATHLMNEAALANNEYGGRRRPSPEHARKVGVEP